MYKQIRKLHLKLHLKKIQLKYMPKVETVTKIKFVNTSF